MPLHEQTYTLAQLLWVQVGQCRIVGQHLDRNMQRFVLAT